VDRRRFDVDPDRDSDSTLHFDAITDSDPDPTRNITKSDCAFYFYSHQCQSISDSSCFIVLFRIIGLMIFNIFLTVPILNFL
jgi:hypothetical protein